MKCKVFLSAVLITSSIFGAEPPSIASQKEERLRKLKALREQVEHSNGAGYLGGYLLFLEIGIEANKKADQIMFGGMPMSMHVALYDKFCPLLQFMLDDGLDPNQEFIEEASCRDKKGRRMICTNRSTLLGNAALVNPDLINVRLLLSRNAKPQLPYVLYVDDPEKDSLVKLLRQHGGACDEVRVIKNRFGGGLP